MFLREADVWPQGIVPLRVAPVQLGKHIARAHG
jgi:hypothetical protein